MVHLDEKDFFSAVNHERQYNFFQVEKYKKPRRPCVFCEKYQAQLNRQIKLKDSDNIEVKEALKLPKVL